jgi:hypothetical protein
MSEVEENWRNFESPLNPFKFVHAKGVPISIATTTATAFLPA